MEFLNDVHQAAYEKLATFCSAEQGFGPANQDAPGFVIRDGNNLIVILALPWSEEQTVFQFRALMVRDVPVSLKAAKWLLEQNDEVVLGAFGWTNDMGLYFGYTIPADSLDEADWAVALAAVGMSARHYAPEIMERFGGKPFFAEDC